MSEGTNTGAGINDEWSHLRLHDGGAADPMDLEVPPASPLVPHLLENPIHGTPDSTASPLTASASASTSRLVETDADGSTASGGPCDQLTVAGFATLQSGDPRLSVVHNTKGPNRVQFSVFPVAMFGGQPVEILACLHVATTLGWVTLNLKAGNPMIPSAPGLLQHRFHHMGDSPDFVKGQLEAIFGARGYDVEASLKRFNEGRLNWVYFGEANLPNDSCARFFRVWECKDRYNISFEDDFVDGLPIDLMSDAMVVEAVRAKLGELPSSIIGPVSANHQAPVTWKPRPPVELKAKPGGPFKRPRTTTTTNALFAIEPDTPSPLAALQLREEHALDPAHASALRTLVDLLLGMGSGTTTKDDARKAAKTFRAAQAKVAQDIYAKGTDDERAGMACLEAILDPEDPVEQTKQAPEGAKDPLAAIWATTKLTTPVPLAAWTAGTRAYGATQPQVLHAGEVDVFRAAGWEHARAFVLAGTLLITSEDEATLLAALALANKTVAVDGATVILSWGQPARKVYLGTAHHSEAALWEVELGKAKAAADGDTALEDVHAEDVVSARVPPSGSLARAFYSTSFGSAVQKLGEAIVRPKVRYPEQPEAVAFALEQARKAASGDLPAMDELRIRAVVAVVFATEDRPRGATIGGTLLRVCGPQLFPEVAARELAYSIELAEDAIEAKMEALIVGKDG